MGKEIPEKDYAKKMKNLQIQTENIIAGAEKGSKSYGKDIMAAFELSVKHNGLREELQKKYEEINSKESLTPSEKYVEFVSFLQTTFNFASKMFGMFGKFGQEEYIKKYGKNSQVFCDKMRQKYDAKIAEMLEDADKEVRHLNSLRIGVMHSKVRAVEKKIKVLLSNMVKDAAVYGDQAKEYFKKFGREAIGERLENGVDRWLNAGGSFATMKINVCEALKFMENDVVSKIRHIIVKVVPRKLTDDNSKALKKCSDNLFANYNPVLVSIKKECDALIKEYSGEGSK